MPFDDISLSMPGDIEEPEDIKPKQEIEQKIEETNAQKANLVDKTSLDKSKELVLDLRNSAIWRRQSYEKKEEYEAFIIYRHLSFNRSLENVADIINTNIVDVVRMCSKYRWDQRIEEYDKYVTNKARAREVYEILDKRKKLSIIIDKYIKEYSALLEGNKIKLDITTKDFIAMVNLRSRIDEDAVSRLLTAVEQDPELINKLTRQHSVEEIKKGGTKQITEDDLDDESLKEEMANKYGKDRLGI